MWRHLSPRGKGTFAFVLGACVGTSLAVWLWPSSESEFMPDDLPFPGYIVAGAEVRALEPLEEPALEIVWMPGFNFNERVEVSFRAWRNGTVIWRDPFVAREIKGPQESGLNKGRYYLGGVKPSEIEKKLQELEQLGAFKLGPWGNVPYDSSYNHIKIQFGDRKADISAMGSLEESRDDFIGDLADDPRAEKVLREIVRIAKGLVPDERMQILDPLMSFTEEAP